MDDDGDDKDDTKRRTRNLSEKKRRDQFNLLVNELGTMVTSNNRKMDKSSVLKSTISFLKNHNEVTVKSRAHDINEESKPAFLCNEEFTYLVLEALEGFVMVFTATGRICYVSEGIASLLGHIPADVSNKSIFDLAYEDDRPSLYNLLQNPGPIYEPNRTVTSENEIVFQCHLKRGVFDFRDEVSYELVQFKGHFRKHAGTNLESLESDDMSVYGEGDSRVLFVCMCKLQTPQLIRDVSLLDSNRNEFTSRHSLEWKFLFLDHRAPPIIGYLPFEVLGTSGYDYYHFDDLEKVVSCHEALMQKGELTSCFYRFLTKGQQWIWLQSRFYITYHQWNSKPEFVVCTHKVVSYADIAKTMKQESVETGSTRQAEGNPTVVKEPATNEPSLSVCVSKTPSCMSETSETFGTYQVPSQTASVKSASVSSAVGASSTAGACATWTHPRYTTGSDTASVSGESRYSQRHGSRETDSGIYTPYTPFGIQRLENEMLPGSGGQYYGHGCDSGIMVYPNKLGGAEPQLVPQHGVGAQYLEPTPYVSAVPAVLPLPVPLIVTSDHAQMQEQLHQKHEQLQQLIARQQDELRRVKEQLLLARLGVLHPMDPHGYEGLSHGYMPPRPPNPDQQPPGPQ